MPSLHPNGMQLYTLAGTQEASHHQLAVPIYRLSLSNHFISLSSGGLTFLKISFTFQVIEISHRFPQSLILSFIPISYTC